MPVTVNGQTYYRTGEVCAMAGISRNTFLRWVREQSFTDMIPVIVVSARGQEIDQEYAREMGADGYITKRFSSHDLLDTINKLLPGSAISKGDQVDENF